MANIIHNDNRSAKWLRRLARGIGSVPAAFWLFIGIASAIGNDEPLTWESYFIAGFTVTAVILTIVAWRREKVGGILLIIFGLLFSTFAYFSAGHNKWIAVLPSGVPFLIAGVLFLASWRASGHTGQPDETSHGNFGVQT